jgi:lysophospholipase L1-like esterase
VILEPVEQSHLGLDKVELHNIAEARPVAGHEGLRLQRVPEEVRLALNEKAQERMLSPACAEIRCVCEAQTMRLTLSSAETTDVVPFFGLFQSRERYTIGPEPQTIEVTMPERLALLDPAFCAGMPFSPRVASLMLAGGPLFVHAISGEAIRPPLEAELPRMRYLAYGTSITHGAAATGPHLTYAAQTARRLGADLINLGVGGSAYCEPELADYIAARDDWHVASLALSVNMIGAGFSLDEFYERVSYMVDTVAGADTARPVLCITIYPHFREYGPQFANPEAKGTPEEYRQRLRDAVSACPHPNVHLVEGPEILRDAGGLTVDLIHPADNGMIQMGEHLARRIAGLL